MKLREISEGRTVQLKLDTKEKIATWLLDEFNISGNSREIIEGDMGQLTVNITRGGIEFVNNEMTRLPVKFGHVEGNFDLGNLPKLKTLLGCPQSVSKEFRIRGCPLLTSLEGGPTDVGEDFDASNCTRLKSLTYGPDTVGGDYHIQGCNGLTNLKGAPRSLVKGFNAQDCKNLISLDGGPSDVGADYSVSGCKKLTTLDGCAEKIGGDFTISGCVSLTSLQHGPKIVKGDYTMQNTGITSFEGVHNFIDEIYGKLYFDIGKKGISRGGLGLVLIKELGGIQFPTAPPWKKVYPPFQIIRKYIEQSDKVFECQNELIEAGYDAYAEL